MNNSIEKSESYSVSDRTLFLINTQRDEVLLLNPEISLIPDKIKTMLEFDYSGYFQKESLNKPLELKINQTIQYETRFLELFIKIPGLKDREDKWFKVNNWYYSMNPEILMDSDFDGKSGIVKNYNEFDLVYTKGGDCLFLKKDSPQYDLMVTRSIDELIFVTSTKTSKRKVGNLYLSATARQVYLGSYNFGKNPNPIYMFSRPNEYNSVEEILLDKAKNLWISCNTDKSIGIFSETGTIVQSKRSMMVDYGEYAKPLSDDFDFRSLWKISSEEYVKKNKVPKSKYSKLYEYLNPEKFFEIFLFSPLGSTLEDNRKWITPEIKSVAENIIKGLMRNIVMTNMTPQPSEMKRKLRSIRTSGYFSDDEKLLKYLLEQHNYYSHILIHSHLLDYFSRSEFFDYLIGDLFQLDLSSLAKRVISEVKLAINEMEFDFLSYYSWIDRQRRLNVRDAAYNDIRLCQISELKNKVGTVLVTKNYINLEDFEFFNDYPHLKEVILKIYSKTLMNRGAGSLPDITIKLHGSKTHTTRILSCSIRLEDIVDFCGGIDKIMEENPELELEILNSEFTSIMISTNNAKFELK